MRVYLKLLMFLVMSISLQAFAVIAQPLEEKIKVLEKMAIELDKACVDPKTNEFRTDLVIKDDQYEINCLEEAKQLNKEFVKIELEIKNQQTQFTGEQDLCAYGSSTNNFDSLTKTSQEMVSLAQKTKCEPNDETGRECLLGVLCSMTSTALASIKKLSPGLEKLLHAKMKKNPENKALKSLDECSEFGASCFSNLMKGIWDMLYSTVDGLWELGKMIVKGTAKLGVKLVKKGYEKVVQIKDSIFNWWSGIEDTTTEKMWKAQDLEDSMLDKFVSDPWGFIKTLGAQMYQDIKKSIITHYGCQEWSGLPYNSKCLQPMESWDCGSCRQKMNVICGVVGFAGGEIVAMLLTGGTIAGVEAASVAVSAGTAKVTSQMAKLISKYPKVAKRLSQVSEGTKSVLRPLGNGFKATRNFISKGWMKLIKSKAFKNIQKAAAKTGVTTVTRILTYPLRQYFKLSEKAFVFGYKTTTKTLTTLKLPKLIHPWKMEKVSELEKAIDPDGMRLTLKKMKDPNAKKTLSQLEDYPEYFMIDDKINQSIVKLDIIEPGYAEQRFVRASNWEFTGKKQEWRLGKFKETVKVTKEEKRYRKALVEVRKLFDTPDVVHARLMQFEDEVVLETYRLNKNFKELDINKQFQLKQKAIENVLAKEEIKHGFKSVNPEKYEPLVLEDKSYSLEEWMEMLQEGHIFNDKTFLQGDMSNLAELLLDGSGARSRHGYYTHRIQFWVLMREMNKNPARFKNFSASDLFKKMGDLKFNRKMDAGNSSGDTIWQHLFDSLERGIYHRPEYFRKTHDDYPFLGPWANLNFDQKKLELLV